MERNETGWSDTLTATDIATELHLNIRTVTDWFGTGKLPGRKIGRNGWTTTRGAYAEFLEAHPDTALYDLTSAQIATELGISDAHTVRRWFRHDGLPGALVRGIGERGATWRTTRAAFTAWYADYLTRGDETPDQPAAETPAGQALEFHVTDELATTEENPA